MPIQSRPTGSQNSDAPQVAQNPRRAFAEDWYQVTLAAPSMVTEVRFTSVDAK
jgi:hypothetical protein